MDINFEVKKYAEETQKDIAQNKLEEGKYCINVYKTIQNFHSPVIHHPKLAFVYKDVSSFLERASEHIASIDESFGVAIETWIFD